MNEKKKTTLTIVAAVLLVIGLVIIFMVSCNGNEDRKDGEIITQAVTNADGEVVTNANGEVVTEVIEAEVVTDAEGEKVTEAVTNKTGEKVTNSSGEKVTQQVTKQTTAFSQPMAVKNLEVDTKVTSATLTWTKVKNCDGYYVEYSLANEENWSKGISVTDTKTEITGLKSNTEYKFRVRAYNGVVTVANGHVFGDAAMKKASTKIDETQKTITVQVLLPENMKSDILEIYIDDKLVSRQEVTYNDSPVPFKTSDQYKGVVKVSAKLVTLGYDEYVTTDTGSATINFSDNYIDYVDGGMD